MLENENCLGENINPERIGGGQRKATSPKAVTYLVRKHLRGGRVQAWRRLQGTGFGEREQQAQTVSRGRGVPRP